MALLSVATAALLFAAAESPSGAAARQDGHASAFKLKDSHGFKLVLQKPVSGGSVVAVYRNADSTVTVAAPAGSTVTAGSDPDGGSAEASVTTPDPKTTPPTTAMRSGQTLMDSALAVGFTPRQAFAMAQNLHVKLGANVKIAGLTVAQAQARWGTHALARAATTPNVVAASAPITNSLCVSTNGDGGDATGRFCDVQRRVQANGTDWYLGDSGTGTCQDTGLRLKQCRGNTSYPSAPNVMVSWKPAGRVDMPKCESKTFSLTYNGVTTSSTVQSCPNHLDPYLGDNHFGINWTGCNNQPDGIGPVDIDHSPPSASAAINVDIKIAWEGILNPCDSSLP